MLFMAEMEVRLPPDMPAEQADELKAREREYSRALQRDGRWPHLWRVAGRFANVSVLDVGSVDELHELLVRPPALSLHGHPRHAAGAPSQRHRPRRRTPCLTVPTC